MFGINILPSNEYSYDELTILDNPTPKSLYELANKIIRDHNQSLIAKLKTYQEFSPYNETELYEKANVKYNQLKDYYHQKSIKASNDSEAGSRIAWLLEKADEKIPFFKKYEYFEDMIKSFKSTVGCLNYDKSWTDVEPQKHYLSFRNLNDRHIAELRKGFSVMIRKVENNLNREKLKWAMDTIVNVIIDCEFFEDALLIIKEKIKQPEMKAKSYDYMTHVARRIFEKNICDRCLGEGVSIAKKFNTFICSDWIAHNLAASGYIREAIDFSKFVTHRKITPRILVQCSRSLFMKFFLKNTPERNIFFDCNLTRLYWNDKHDEFKNPPGW